MKEPRKTADQLRITPINQRTDTVTLHRVEWLDAALLLSNRRDGLVEANQEFVDVCSHEFHSGDPPVMD